MTAITVEQFYENFIKLMPTTEQLQLVALITHRLAADLPLIEALDATQLPELDRKVQSDLDAYKHIDEVPEAQKGSPKAVLQLAGTLALDEAEAILQAAQTTRRIDWEMWEGDTE